MCKFILPAEIIGGALSLSAAGRVTFEQVIDIAKTVCKSDVGYTFLLSWNDVSEALQNYSRYFRSDDLGKTFLACGEKYKTILGNLFLGDLDKPITDAIHAVMQNEGKPKDAPVGYVGV